MLSPMSYDGAPTPPPQPSPGAFKSSTLDRYHGNQYSGRQATSPRQEVNRFTHEDPLSPSQTHRQYGTGTSPASRQMNGGYSTMPSRGRHDNVVAHSHTSASNIRKDNPPSMNITAKSVSSPSVNLNSHDHNRNIKQPEEDLALAR